MMAPVCALISYSYSIPFPSNSISYSYVLSSLSNSTLVNLTLVLETLACANAISFALASVIFLTLTGSFLI